MKPDGVEHRMPPRPVHRRDLFRLRTGGPARTAAPETMPAVPNSSPAGPGGAGAIINASRPLMGSYFEVRVGSGVPGAVDLATRALDAVEELEACLTVYDDGSEVSRLNADAHRGPTRVSADVAAVLGLALEIGRASGGAYDPTAGALSLAWGFTRGPRRVPDPAALADARARTGAGLVELDADARTVRFSKPGVVLNFGSIGKGYAVDRAADVVRRHWWPTTTLIHGGRSSLYALGSPPDDFGGRWAVALTDPDHPDAALGTVHLRNRGMATSGSAFQRFAAADGATYGHIIDPRTGSPPTVGPTSVTVLAPTAAEADAWSTAFYLLGAEGAAPILAGRPDLGAIFVEPAAGDRPGRVVPINVTNADYTPGPRRG